MALIQAPSFHSSSSQAGLCLQFALLWILNLPGAYTPTLASEQLSNTAVDYSKKKNRNAVNILFLNNLLSQVRQNRALHEQVKVRVKDTVILLLESFSKQLFISWKFY